MDTSVTLSVAANGLIYLTPVTLTTSGFTDIASAGVDSYASTGASTSVTTFLQLVPGTDYTFGAKFKSSAGGAQGLTFLSWTCHGTVMIVKF